jgi:type IV pilus biogenesis protein CpaD/CtpE
MSNTFAATGRIAKPGARTLSVLAALSLLALAGCDQIDPLSRPYMWHETGVNAQNIAAMAVNPADLVHGRNSPRRRAATDSDSVERLWAGRPVALPSDTPGASAGGTTATGGGGSSSTGGGN